MFILVKKVKRYQRSLQQFSQRITVLDIAHKSNFVTHWYSYQFTQDDLFTNLGKVCLKDDREEADKVQADE